MVINWRRPLRHLFFSPRAVQRCFAGDGLMRIEQAITHSEGLHTGEICFAVEHALDVGPLWRGLSARERALEVFAQRRVWDTAQNNGVLIYLLLADRDVEIVADRGIHAKVGTEAWERICRGMEDEFRKYRYTEGVVAGIQSITQHLALHFPVHAQHTAIDELSNQPTVL